MPLPCTFFCLRNNMECTAKAVTNPISEVTIMCNGNGFFGGNSCWWIIILILLFCCCGNGSGNLGCGCDNNNCGCC